MSSVDLRTPWEKMEDEHEAEGGAIAGMVNAFIPSLVSWALIIWGVTALWSYFHE